MKKFILAVLIFSLSTVTANALPGGAVYPAPKNKIWDTYKGNKYGPVPCVACHVSNKKYEQNIYFDVRDANDKSYMKNGIINIPYKPGETVAVKLVVGTRKKDSAKLAGWFFNLPYDATLGHGSVNYCYQSINYPLDSAFSADGKSYRTSADVQHITMGKYMHPQTTELWIGVGDKTTETKPGSQARKETLALRTVKINWVIADDM